MNKQSNQTKKNLNGKKSYQAPLLTRYGNIEPLTAGGLETGSDFAARQRTGS